MICEHIQSISITAHVRDASNDTMTTNVHDIKKKVLAVDSRWSVEINDGGPQALLFVDDINYQKIICTDKYVAMFAGYASLINEWKVAISIASYAGNYDFKSLGTKGIAILILDIHTGKTEITIKHKMLGDEASFAGTGSDEAMKSWPSCKDAIKVVEMAKIKDYRTGGQVRTYDYGNNVSSLGPDGAYSAYCQEFIRKGMVMYTGKPSEAIPVATASASDRRIHDAANSVANGQLQTSAPFDGMEEDLTQAEKDALFSSLDNLFRKNESKSI